MADERKEKKQKEEERKRREEEESKRRAEQEERRRQSEENDRKIKLVAKKLREMPPAEEADVHQLIESDSDSQGIPPQLILAHAIKTYYTVCLTGSGKYQGSGYRNPPEVIKPKKMFIVVSEVNGERNYNVDYREVEC